jgi:predicted MFS family arabinose efflux permease
VAGRLADRRGPLWPARAGLVAGGVALALLPLPRDAVVLGALVILTAPLLGMLWTPAMAVLAEGSERRAVDAAYGFGLANMAWGAGAAIGAGGGGALADATTDAVPLLALAAAMLAAAVLLRRARL